MSTTNGVLRELMANAAVDRCLELTARMFALHHEVVTTIVQVGLPMMARMAERNPELLRRMYAASRAPLPEPLAEFYERMLASRALRQAIVDDYRALYGSLLEAVHRQTALQVGATDGQARDILATMLPAVNHALGQANVSGDKQGFMQQLKDLQV